MQPIYFPSDRFSLEHFPSCIFTEGWLTLSSVCAFQHLSWLKRNHFLISPLMASCFVASCCTSSKTEHFSSKALQADLRQCVTICALEFISALQLAQYRTTTPYHHNSLPSYLQKKVYFLPACPSSPGGNHSNGLDRRPLPHITSCMRKLSHHWFLPKWPGFPIIFLQVHQTVPVYNY